VKLFTAEKVNITVKSQLLYKIAQKFAANFLVKRISQEILSQREDCFTRLAQNNTFSFADMIEVFQGCAAHDGNSC
jgi:hypothetical protein